MKDLIVSLFGRYEPVMSQEFIVMTDPELGTYTQTIDVVANGFAGVDWPWVMGVLLFAIVLWSLFRLLGVFFK